MKSEEWLGARVGAFVRLLLEWGERNYRDFSWRKHLSDPYKVLVAEILLQKTSARKVEAIYDLFLSKFPTERELARTTAEEVALIIEPTGLQTKKARSLVEAAKLLVSHGISSSSIKMLSKINGISSYTLNSVLSFCYGERVPIVDVNVKRVVKVVFGVENEAAVKKVLTRCLKLLDEESAKKFNFALLDLGAALEENNCFLNDSVAIVPLCEDSLEEFLLKRSYWRFRQFDFKRPISYLACYEKSPKKAITYISRIKEVKIEGPFVRRYLSEPIKLSPPIRLKQQDFPPVSYKYTTVLKILRAKSYLEV